MIKWDLMSELVNKILDGEPVRSVLMETDLTEMANLVGKKVKIEPIDFSFYFSDKREVNHGIRVKVKWNRDHLAGGTDGYFELHGDYPWVQSADGVKKDQKGIQKARNFFKKYKVLFAAVWEGCLDADVVQDYFKGVISFNELLQNFLIAFDFIGIKSLKELEKCVRLNNLFNMND